MTFHNKIRAWIGRFHNRKFRASVVQEKKRKYLFSAKETSPFKSSRISAKKKDTPLLRPFSPFLRTLHFENRNPFIFLIGFIGVILIGLSAYILLFSPYFRLSPSRVVVEPMENTVNTDLVYRAIEGIYGQFIFGVNIDRIRSDILSLQKQVQDVEIRRLYPNGLKVIVTPYPTIFHASIAFLDREFFLTSNGVIVPNTSGSGAGDMPNIEIVSRSLRDELFLDYKQVISPDTMASIMTVKQTLEHDFPDLHFWLYRYFPNERELHISLESGTRILFSLDDTVADTLTNELITFQIYARKYGDELGQWGVTYVDIRVIGEVFVCRELTVCGKNLADIYGDIYR